MMMTTGTIISTQTPAYIKHTKAVEETFLISPPTCDYQVTVFESEVTFICYSFSHCISQMLG